MCVDVFFFFSLHIGQFNEFMVRIQLALGSSVKAAQLRLQSATTVNNGICFGGHRTSTGRCRNTGPASALVQADSLTVLSVMPSDGPDL